MGVPWFAHWVLAALKADMYYQKDLTTHASFVERVTERMKVLGLSIPQAAQLSDIKEATLKNILYKDVEISRTALVSLAFALETTVEYLAAGSRTADAEGASDSVTLAVQAPEYLGFVEGFINTEPRPSDHVKSARTIPIPRKSLINEGVDPVHVRAVKVKNDRLKPDLDDGDVALVDISDRVLAEGFFVVAIRDAVVLRFASPSVRGFLLQAFSHHVGGTLVNMQADGTFSDPEIKVIGRIFSRISIQSL